MAQEARELICMITSGTDHELSSVGFTIAKRGDYSRAKGFYLSEQQWRPATWIARSFSPVKEPTLSRTCRKRVRSSREWLRKPSVLWLRHDRR